MWGQNGRGALGLGRGDWVWGGLPGEMAQTDVNLGTGKYVKALAMACYFDGAVGTGHSCAIVSDRENPGCLKCWGANDKGQVSACCRSAARARGPRLTTKKARLPGHRGPGPPPLGDGRQLAVRGSWYYLDFPGMAAPDGGECHRQRPEHRIAS